MSGGYEDIIHLLHHVSSKRPPIPMSDRAARFSPFAALTGYDDVIREMGRLTEQKIQLDEEALAILDEKFHVLQEHLDEYPEIQFIYFKPDEPKVGGKNIHNGIGYCQENPGIRKEAYIRGWKCYSNRRHFENGKSNIQLASSMARKSGLIVHAGMFKRTMSRCILTRCKTN